MERTVMAADDGKTVLVDEQAGAAAPRGADHTGGRPAASGRVAPLLVTFATGMAVGGPLTFLATEYFEDPARAILSFGTPFFLGLAALVGVGTLAAYWFLARWLPDVLGTLNRIVAAGRAAARAAKKEDYEAALDDAGRAAKEAAAWYGRSAIWGWSMRAALAVFVAFGGVLGTALLFRQIALLREQNIKIEAQTALLQEQNEKLDQQTVTAEAARRGALSTEMFELIQAAAELPREGDLPRAFVARVVAFTRAATPFFYVRVAAGRRAGPELIERPLSPERGQLLVGLLAAGADLAPLIEARATFKRADLRGADLRGADLSGADLSGATFEGAIVGDVIGDRLEPGRLPTGFPRGWEGPPPGWELVRGDGGLVRLRRSGTPPPAPPAPSR